MHHSKAEAKNQGRETFRISRQSEFFTEAELTKQIGYRRELWPIAIVKELVDNSLDNCEEHGILPAVSIALSEDSLSVRDNGSGIPADTVSAMLDFTTRTSSREAYRSPTRGTMGNAAKCVLGCPYVLNDGAGRVVIEAHGIRHELAMRLDTLSREPVVTHEKVHLDQFRENGDDELPSTHERGENGEKVPNGTFVRVWIDNLPGTIDDHELHRFVLFALGYATLNPHLSLKLTLPDGTSHASKRTSETISKWTASDLEPANWYDIESFELLVGATIQKDRERGVDRSLRDFVRQFAGLRRSAALKAVVDDTGLQRAKLSALLSGNDLDHDKARALLAALKEHGKPVPAKKLGVVGRDHMRKTFGLDLKYKVIRGECDGLPFVVEAAFAELDEGDQLVSITGCNFSPSIDRPVVRMLDSLLAKQYIDEDSAVVFVLHIATVAPTYLDRGKSVVEVRGELGDAVEKAVVSVTRDYAKERRADELYAERKRRAPKVRTKPKVSLKDAIIRVLKEAEHNASGGGVCEFDDRDLYYAARKLIQQFTDAALTQKYFDQVVDAWEEVNGLIVGRLRSPRGFFLEPHTGKQVPLGTKAVDEYQIPMHLMSRLLYTEKKGLLPKFQLGKIAERFDAGIICAEGYAVRAAKQLIQNAQQGHKMQVLCFHDADPSGYHIFQTLSKATGAHRYNIEVIDAGLHLQEALDMGLEPETFTRKKAFPSGLNLTELERQYFTGEITSVITKRATFKARWENCRRVELNALSADPHKFVTWVESKLAQHGCDEKLVPPKKVIETRAREELDSILSDHISSEIDDYLNLASLIDPIRNALRRQVDVKGIPKELQVWAQDLPPEHWSDFLSRRIRKDVRGLNTEIREKVAAKLREVLS